jgi:Xaa-Pro aminopeptidase
LEKNLFSVTNIEKGIELVEYTFQKIKSRFQPGMTEENIHQIISEEFYLAAKKKILFTSDILSGERTAEISGEATEKVIENGDAVILDIQPFVNGYSADITRTFIVGEPSSEFITRYQWIEKCLSVGEEMLKPGILACDIYNAVEQHLNSYVGVSFPHHAGHGIGRESFELPHFISNCSMPLEEGMIVTLEPGLYDKHYGIRLENNYLINANGFKKLGNIETGIEFYIIKA